MERDRDRDFINAIDRECIDALASLGERGAWAQGVVSNRRTVACSFPEEIADNDPAVERLRECRDQVVLLVSRRDEGSATIGD